MPNVPDQRPRASNARHGTATLSRGSLHPVCWAIRSSRRLSIITEQVTQLLLPVVSERLCASVLTAAIAPHGRLSKANPPDNLHHRGVNSSENGGIVRVPPDNKAGRGITVRAGQNCCARPCQNEPTNSPSHYGAGLFALNIPQHLPSPNGLINQGLHFRTCSLLCTNQRLS